MKKMFMLFLLSNAVYATSMVPPDIGSMNEAVRKFEKPHGLSDDAQRNALDDLLKQYKEKIKVKTKDTRPTKPFDPKDLDPNPENPNDPNRGDPANPELKACVSHSHCTGEGAEKICDTWEVCVGT